MNINDLFTPTLTLYKTNDCLNKKRIIDIISTLTCNQDSHVKQEDVLKKLQYREKIGTTSIGSGIAIPHACIPHLKKPLCIVLKLAHPIPFSAHDNSTVNLIFALLIPEGKHEAHLKILSALSQKLRNTTLIKQIEAANNDNALFLALTE